MQKNKHQPLKKILLIITGILLILVIIVIAFISPIVKYTIERYDVKYTGREITMDWAYVNPFTGYVHFKNFKFHELNSDSSFFACSGISAHLNMKKILHKEYEVEDLSISSPIFTVIQHSKTEYNFSDLITKFSKKPDQPKTDTTPVHFNLLNLKITDGIFIMNEKMTPVEYSIKNLNVESSGKRWNADTIDTKFSFDSGIGSGHIEGHFNVNLAKKEYSTDVIVKKLDLKILEQYMKELSNYGTTRAFIDMDVKAKGNLKEPRDVEAKGIVQISDFHFGKSKEADFASFDKFNLSIKLMNPYKKKFFIDSISLLHPYFKFQKYDHLDNIQNMFGKDGAKVKETAQDPEKFNLVIEIARYVKLLSKDFLRSDYQIDRLGIYKGDLHFEDFSANEKFSVAANPLSIIADSVHSNNKRVKISLNTGIKPYGSFHVMLSIDPKDSSNFEMNYALENVNATLMNPYLISKTTFPLDRGSIDFKGSLNVQKGIISSENHLLIVDPRVTKRIKKNNNKWLPVKFLLFFVRERGNSIDYKIPITGDLKNPKFHLKDVILDIITNVFVKPATPRYGFEIRTIDNNLEKMLAFNWQLRSAELMPDNQKFVDNLIDFLKNNPTASIVVEPVEYFEKENEYIAFFEAKKEYFIKKNNIKLDSFSEDDSSKVEKISIKDSLFVQYLDNNTKNKLLFTIQEKCRALIGEKLIESKYRALIKAREEHFISFFKKEGLNDRVKIKPDIRKIPFNGFSYYKITYNGKIPPETKEAFDKLYEWDNENPRQKAKKERRRLRDIFIKK
ncbi:MAG: DUF748 domain-containing protein [Bacteroidia bacterium]